VGKSQKKGTGWRVMPVDAFPVGKNAAEDCRTPKRKTLPLTRCRLLSGGLPRKEAWLHIPKIIFRPKHLMPVGAFKLTACGRHDDTRLFAHVHVTPMLSFHRG
jgi:hypothetical protein